MTTTATIPDSFAELNEKGDRVELFFDYNKEAVLAAKRIPGYKFVAKDKGGPLWRYPRDLTTCRRLREEFGMGLELGKGLKKWARQAADAERELRSLSGSEDATLERVPKKLAKYLRPYQRADVAFMARTNALNANQPGLGKSITTIASIFESGTDDGPQLIVGPKTSLETVWLTELDRWLPEDVPVFVVSGDDKPEERLEIVAEFAEHAEAGEACWMITNPAMIRFIDNPDYEPPIKGEGENPEDYGEEVEESDEPELIPAFPELFQIRYKNVVFDEYHKQGLVNPKSKMYKAGEALRKLAERSSLLSGTPMGGKPIKLWGALHFLEPESYTSRWRWVDQWLEVEEDRYGKKVKGIRPGREDAFYEAMAPHMVRRTKKELIKDLPDKQIIDIYYDMTPKQKKQYVAMATDAEVKIEEQNLSATGILAEYMRLKQFADAHQKVRHLGTGELVVKPTMDSGMLPHIQEILEERGISGDPEQQFGEEQVVLGSQFSSIVDMLCEWLEKQGIPAMKITGDVTRKGERKRIQDAFQGQGEYEGQPRPRVLCLTTTAGGVSINLDRADTMIICDETWDPDDQEQLEDRSWWRGEMERANLTVFYLRAKDSIEEYIKKVTMGKAVTNKEILDLRRSGFRAIQG